MIKRILIFHLFRRFNSVIRDQNYMFFYINQLKSSNKDSSGIVRMIIVVLVSVIVVSCNTSRTVINDPQNYDIPVKVSLVTLDKLGNIYILDNENKISVYNTKNQLKYEYADNTLGKITTVDASDPLKVLIYKKDYGILIILDNTLAELNRINLYDLNFQSISTVATALDGNIWLYDNANYQLIKINEKGNELINSQSMIDQGLQHIDPFFILEKSGKVVMQDAAKGIFLFDNLGQFIQTFPFQINQKIQFDGINILYYQNKKLISYNTRFYDETEIILDPDLNSAELLNVKLLKSNLYYIYNNGIRIKQYGIGE